MTEALPPAPAALPEQEADECSVCVAVHVRPLIDSELQEGCDALLTTTPQQPQVCVADLPLNCDNVQTALQPLSTCNAQVITGAHSFTYDHVFGADSTPPDQLYGHCVEPLVSGLFKGYNATGVCKLLHEQTSKHSVVRLCVTHYARALQSAGTSMFVCISK